MTASTPSYCHFDSIVLFTMKLLPTSCLSVAPLHRQVGPIVTAKRTALRVDTSYVPSKADSIISPSSFESTESTFSSGVSIKLRRWIFLHKSELSDRAYRYQKLKRDLRNLIIPGRQVLESCRSKATRIFPSPSFCSPPESLEVTFRADYPPPMTDVNHPKLNPHYPYRYSPRFSLTSIAAEEDRPSCLVDPVAKTARPVRRFPRRDAISAPAVRHHALERSDGLASCKDNGYLPPSPLCQHIYPSSIISQAQTGLSNRLSPPHLPFSTPTIIPDAVPSPLFSQRNGRETSIPFNYYAFGIDSRRVIYESQPNNQPARYACSVETPRRPFAANHPKSKS